MSSSAEIGTFDYVVVGGGTAGAIVAARLSEDHDTRVCLIEAGPSDVGMDDVLLLRRWLSLLEGPIDLAYPTTLQPRGNAHIVHSRAAVLGGCSSHNTQIFFKPFPGDWQDWVDRGRRRLGAGGHGAVLRPPPDGAPDRRREGPQPAAAGLDPVRGRGRRRTGQPRLERRAVPRRRRLPRRRLRPGDRRPLVVQRRLPAPDHGPAPEPDDPHRHLGAAGQPRERPRRLRQHGQRRGAGRARDHRLRRLDRHAPPAAAVRHRAGGRSRRAGHRGAARTCPASART